MQIKSKKINVCCIIHRNCEQAQHSLNLTVYPMNPHKTKWNTLVYYMDQTSGMLVTSLNIQAVRDGFQSLPTISNWQDWLLIM